MHFKKFLRIAANPLLGTVPREGIDRCRQPSCSANVKRVVFLRRIQVRSLTSRWVLAAQLVRKEGISATIGARPHRALIIALRRQAPQWQKRLPDSFAGDDHRSMGTSPIVAEIPTFLNTRTKASAFRSPRENEPRLRVMVFPLNFSAGTTEFTFNKVLDLFAVIMPPNDQWEQIVDRAIHTSVVVRQPINVSLSDRNFPIQA